jgi:septum formation protein
MTLILASGSASRRAMLTAAGVAHEVIPADVDEAAIKDMLLAEGAPPGAIALALAEAKATAVSNYSDDRLVLGGDSIVIVRGKIFDKPTTREHAADHLRLFSGETMTLMSAAVLASGGRIAESVVDTASLHCRLLSNEFIEDYLDHEWPEIAGCVGCFRMESRGVQLFDAVNGSHFTVLGMPLLWVLAALRRQGELA